MNGERFEPGGLALHRGRAYVMRGYSRMSLEGRQYVSLEDPETGARFSVPADEAFPVPLPPDEPNQRQTDAARGR
jgi:hypothetical protein